MNSPVQSIFSMKFCRKEMETVRKSPATDKNKLKSLKLKWLNLKKKKKRGAADRNSISRAVRPNSHLFLFF